MDSTLKFTYSDKRNTRYKNRRKKNSRANNSYTTTKIYKSMNELALLPFSFRVATFHRKCSECHSDQLHCLNPTKQIN